MILFTKHIILSEFIQTFVREKRGASRVQIAAEFYNHQTVYQNAYQGKLALYCGMHEVSYSPLLVEVVGIRCGWDGDPHPKTITRTGHSHLTRLVWFGVLCKLLSTVLTFSSEYKNRSLHFERFSLGLCSQFPEQIISWWRTCSIAHWSEVSLIFWVELSDARGVSKWPPGVVVVLSMARCEVFCLTTTHFNLLLTLYRAT